MKTNIIFFIISRSFFLSLRNLAAKISRGNQNTHFGLRFFLNRAICGIIRKNAAKGTRPRKKIWRMRFACWIPKAAHSHTHTHTHTHTHREYIIHFALTQ
jgi:hypothetical protein